MFLADHIAARKTSSSYNSTLPNTEQAAVIKSANLTFEAQPLPFRQRSSMFARPSLSPSLSALPTVFRATPSPQKTLEVQSSSSICSSDNELFLGDADADADADTDSQSSTGAIAGTAEVQQTPSSSGVSSASIKTIIKETGFKRKRTIPLPDQFAIKKKKKDEDVLTQAILTQTTALSSMAAKLGDSFSNSNASNSSAATSNNPININEINPIMGAIAFALQSVPVERHLACMMELLSIITEKYVQK